MKLHGFLGVSYLISHAFAYHYIVTVPNTYPVGTVSVELVVPTDGNLNYNFGPFRSNLCDPFFTTTSCYDPVTSITYPSAGFEIFSKQNTQLSLNNIYYTCSYLGLDSASNINAFRSPDSDDEIVDPASPTTATSKTATAAITTSTTSTASPTTSATTTSVSPAQTCTETSKARREAMVIMMLAVLPALTVSIIVLGVNVMDPLQFSSFQLIAKRVFKERRMEVV